MTPEDKTTEAKPSTEVRSDDARRAYKKPALRRLGSVRDLTLGTTGTANDARGQRQPGAPPMM